MKTLPEGESRCRLLDEISCLDVIADVMRKALDSMPALVASDSVVGQPD
jgi:hypothetical protein